MAIKGNFFPKKIFIYDKIFYNYNIIKPFFSITYLINKKNFKKLVYRENSDGIAALFKEHTVNKLKNIKITNNCLILIFDGIEKPGNLGAMLRTANAAGAHFIILCNIKTYIFNSNIIRSSLGSVFTSKIIIENEIKLIVSWLQKNNIKIVVTGIYKNAKNLYKTNLSFSKIAIILGSEDKGVSNIWLNKTKKIITIPMFGTIDSLNVSNAMSIIIYEIIRQRYYLNGFRFS
ncbi:TrmH family RNA methyltransferase [Blattabacterium cuenoti]|uniref:TrmH family RNA methyltransferase n=1 Tax=Blattabacterium cuenoti TaxID=1653831 RepID=UPI001EEA2915|nr:TrmH family RNA methyltransferase [Blattabacterium cuenoti]